VSEAEAEPASRRDGPGFYSGLVAEYCSEVIFVTDAQGRIEWANAAFARVTGYETDGALGRMADSLLAGRDTDRGALARLSEAFATRRPVQVEVLNYTSSGRAYWAEVDVQPVFAEDGRHTHFLVVSREVTERRLLQERAQALNESEEFQSVQRRLLSEMSEWLYSAKSMAELLAVVELSMATMMPEAEGGLYVYAEGRGTLDLTARWGDGDLPSALAPDACWALRRGRAYRFGAQAIQLPCGHAPQGGDSPYFCLPVVAQGETIGLLFLVFPAFGGAGGQASEEFLRQRWEMAQTCAEQISLAVANVQMRQLLERRTMEDPLTGLHNRRWLMDAGAAMLAEALAHGRPVALIALDVDHFKAFNDRFGHEAGDIVLRALGDVLREPRRERVSAARIGGEEFAMLVPGLAGAEAVALADALRRRLAELRPAARGRPLPPVTISAGVAVAPTHGTGMADLLRAADRALYAAKAAGRDTVMTVADAAAGGPLAGDDEADAAAMRATG
jgi:diguanylate cyclase (GGDEF)-like protein/PAS domain S-box-containing protein